MIDRRERTLDLLVSRATEGLSDSDDLELDELLNEFVDIDPDGFDQAAAVLDSASPGSTASFDITPLVAPYSTDSTLGQSQPNVARVGDRVFVSWRSDAVLADVNAEDLWLKEISWSSSGGSITLDLSKPEIALPRWSAHLKDDQRYPGLAATPLLPGGALVAAWDDYGRGFGSVEGTPDVVSELIPIPLVRLQSDGGAGQ